MSNPTSNFGWQMPTPGDLVTDLPADFEVFGQAVDTSLADLKGGTSGQILAKNSNTDMDFVWIANDQGDITAVNAGTGITGGGTSGAVTITNDMATTITTNGDLIYGTGSGTYTRRGIGSTGQVLTVSGGVPTWATPAAGSGDFVLINTTSFSGVSSQSVNDVFSSTYDNYVIKFNTSSASTDAFIHFRMRVGGTDTTANYKRTNIQLDNTASYVSRSTTDNSFRFVGYVQPTFNNEFTFNLANPFQTKVTSANGSWGTGAEANIEYNLSAWGLNDTTSYTGFTFITSVGNVSGSVSVYGYKK